jgi:hypothetical protein
MTIVDLANEIMDDPAFAPLPAGQAELHDVEIALRTVVALGDRVAANRYWDRVRNLFGGESQMRIARMIGSEKGGNRG